MSRLIQTVLFSGFILAVAVNQSHALQSYYTNGVSGEGSCTQSGCHTTAVATKQNTPSCTGCHAHGARANPVTALDTDVNLFAEIGGSDKVFNAGDDIFISFSGGDNFPGRNREWFGLKVYDQAGTHLDTVCDDLVRCTYPVEFAVEAKPGMTKLFISWVGHQFDASQSKSGNTGGVVAVGWRNMETANHIEEIVETESFSVTGDVSPPSSGSPGAGNGNSGSSSERASVGSLSIWLIGFLILIRIRQNRNVSL